MNEESSQEKQHWIVYPLGSKPRVATGDSCWAFSSI